MTRAELETLVTGCPFHRLLGVALDDFDVTKGWVSLSLDTKEELSRSDKRIELHGGVLASMLDLAGDYAVALKLGRGVPTISFNIDYLRPARGQKLLACAQLVKCGKSIAVAEMEAFDEDGALVAIGRGTYSAAPIHS